MTQLRRMTSEEVERRNYSEGTIRYYLRYCSSALRNTWQVTRRSGSSSHLPGLSSQGEEADPGTVEHHVAAP